MSQQVWNGKYVSADSAMARVDATNGVTAQLLSSGTITASANTSVFNMAGANALYVYWEVNAISGSGASLTIIPQSSATQGGSYTQFMTSGAQTAVGSGSMLTLMPGGANPNQFFRVNLTVAGTSPSIKYAIYVVPFYIGENA